MKPIKVAIESPFKGDEKKNEEFCRNICRYAVLNGFNPFAMHIFFTQFLKDSVKEERHLGITCGLDWTDHADEVWFCLRTEDEISEGMLLAIKRNKELISTGKIRTLKFLIFSQEGERQGEWVPRTES